MARICKRRVSGSFTVYFAMISTMVVMLLMALLYAGRRTRLTTQVRKDLDLSAQAALSEYQQDWQEEYGLYMVPESRLSAAVSYYMEQNCQHPLGGYDVENLVVGKEGTLADPACLEEEIDAFMRERGALSILEETIQSLSDLESSPEGKEAQQLSENSETLASLQYAYSELITDLYGVRADPFPQDYCVKKILREDPSWEEVKTVLDSLCAGAGDSSAPPSLSAEDLGILERAITALYETKAVCEDAVLRARAVKKELETLSEEEAGQLSVEIPITPEDMDAVVRACEKDEPLLDRAAMALEKQISLLETDGPAAEHEEAAEEFYAAMNEYDPGPELPYEVHENTQSWDFAGILKRLEGFSEEIDTLAPDEDRDLGLENMGTSEEEEEAWCFPKWDETLTVSGEEVEKWFLLTEYDLKMFRNFAQTNAQQEEGTAPVNLRGEKMEHRYFKNETEFLICGKNNEFKNVNGTRRRIIGLRMISNMAFLLTDPDKQAQISSFANAVGGIVFPGVGSTIVYAAVVTLWGYGESVSDYRTLWQGGRVPLWKDTESWQTDLSDLLTSTSDTIEGKEGGHGLSYAQYLRILLYTVGKDTLLQRTQALLYLNHGKFPLDEAVTSFSLSGTADGLATLTFKGKYQYVSAK